MTQEELVKYKAVFDEIDKDGNGVIDLSEYRDSLFTSHLSKWQKIRAVSFFNLLLFNLNYKMILNCISKNFLQV